MDRLEEIGSQLSNLTMWDIKSAYTTAKNYALNIPEMEAKVREATNDEAWGASSTLMQEIAQGTHNYQEFNEIMPTIYRRFMEKEAKQWRQIYKALVLLEYIIKHGSERVVDDARSHLSTVKILRNFHHIDEKGKDQGINVRNRAKEVAELLSDLDRVRVERRKARANRGKYTGEGNMGGFGGGGGSKYGGFSSDQYYSGARPSFSGDGYTGGRGYRGSSSRGQPEYDEYDAGEWEDREAGSSRNGGNRNRDATSAGRNGKQAETTKKPAEKPKEVNLFDLDDEPVPAATPAAAPAVPAAKPATTGNLFDNDDFDDFQAAPSAAVTTATPAAAQAAPTAGGNNVFDLLGGPSSSAAPAVKPAVPSGTFTSPVMKPQTVGTGSFSTPIAPSTAKTASTTSTGGGASGGSGGLSFDDLWTSSIGGSSSSSSSGAAGGKEKMSMAEMAQQKSAQSVWGTTGAATGAGGVGAMGAGARAPSAPQGGQQKSQDVFDLL